jgi:Cathepsin propeptide inhibitor domain (I29)
MMRRTFIYVLISFLATTSASIASRVNSTYKKEEWEATIMSRSPKSSIEGPPSRSQLAAEGRLKYMSMLPEEHVDLFTTFVSDHRKVYIDEKEKMFRLEAFVYNLARIDERNEKEREAGGTAIHGITRFADLTPDEFRSQYLGDGLGLSPLMDAHIPDVSSTTATSPRRASLQLEGDRVARNWTGIYTTPVKDQGEILLHL